MFKRECQVRFPISDTDTGSMKDCNVSLSTQIQVCERLLMVGSVWFMSEHFFWNIFRDSSHIVAYCVLNSYPEITEISGWQPREQICPCFLGRRECIALSRSHTVNHSDTSQSCELNK